jgi:colanic acid/amylovoran biosynthesis protein
VVIESGTHLADNLGDLAMLQVTVARLRSHWGPSLRIRVLSADPQRLALHCPGVEPLPAAGRYRWLASGGPAERLLGRDGRSAADDRPQRLRLRLSAIAHHRGDADVRALVAAVARADALVFAGRGGTTGAFLADSMQTLALAGAGAALGIPVAAFGQGIGPIDDAALADRARAVLPRLALIGVREPEHARAELERAGVEPRRVRVTGDDALALALPAGRRPVRGGSIGVGLRGFPPIGLAGEQLDAFAPHLRAAVRRLGSELVALPVALGLGDEEAIRRLAGEAPFVGGGDVRTVPDLIARAGRCRAVVTGSYHSAVFALGQGVPVVAIAASGYYRGKFGGLAALFPGGVELIDADAAGELVGPALERAWHAPAALRERLVAAAAEQVAASERAYADFAALVDGG